MAVDTKRPKGYRKAWNGGKPPSETPETLHFYEHLDGCWQCRNHPFDLCAVGGRLMREAIVGKPASADPEDHPHE